MAFRKKRKSCAKAVLQQNGWSRSRKADRSPIAEVSKQHGVSGQTIYTWRKRFGATSADEIKRLRQLVAENARLKRMRAEATWRST